MILSDRCKVCRELRPCAALVGPMRVTTLICQECVSLAYAEFLVHDVEQPDNDVTKPPTS